MMMMMMMLPQRQTQATDFSTFQPLQLLRRLFVLLPFLSAIISTFFTRGVQALTCYECQSLELPECGPQFRSAAFTPLKCNDNVTVCALQRQRAIPSVRQLAAIARTCYNPGSLPGLNASVGCRTWTNANNFTALYCFCDTDLCNAAAARQPALQLRLLWLLGPSWKRLESVFVALFQLIVFTVVCRPQ